MITINCSICGKEYKVKPYRLTDSVNHFCSKECQSTWRRENIKGHNHPSWKGGGEIKPCATCGKNVHAQTSRVKIGRGKFCSPECYWKWLESSKSMTGHNNPRWLGGITPEDMKARNSRQSHKWKASVFERDNFACQKCGETRTLNAHHLKSFTKYPGLRFDINNGMTLCEKCHTEIHIKLKKGIPC